MFPSAAHRLVTTLALAALAGVAGPLPAQSRITTPKEAFGANFGDDYFLANYTQISGYWRTLEQQSDRLKLVEIGKTAEGRPHLMAIVTSPENHRNLARLKEISSKLAHAEGLTDDQARALAKEGRTVVWIDGGLHATETLGAQQLGETVYQMVSRTDEETLRFLNDCVILFVHANPDGNELVADWYMRNPVPTERSLANVPRLYQKYIGHDNNRDFFASTQAETENINRVLYREWYPQLLYNHHQSGPAGTVVYSPPLRDPYNFNLHPALILGLQSLGAAMHTRLVVENKPGATMRSGGPYDGWWNGGIRNTATFHNTIAMLTEMIGSPTPMRIPFVANRQVPGGDIAMPIAPQEWHLRQSVDYSVSLNRAVLDYASRLRENTLYNFYAMGKSSIERGNRDFWTANPRRIAEVTGQPIFTSGGAVTGGGGGRGGAGRGGGNDADVWAKIQAPELRDPRGFIIPSSQRDFPTAVKFINALLETGITVQRATREFTVAGKTYPAGSFVVPAAQAFRPHVIDMFEPQRHPDVFPFPGSAPTPPYDNAGWTLAFQMGVEFDRILDAFSGPFETVTDWNLKAPAGTVSSANGASGFVISNATNDAFRAANQLLAAGEQVSRLTAPLTVGAVTYPAGALYITARGTTRARLSTVTAALGVNADGVRVSAPGNAIRLRPARTGLWDMYGGSMTSGWTRWILEQFDFPFSRVFAPGLDAGALSAKYDVLIFPNGAIPGARGGRGGRGGGADAVPANLPAEYAGQMGQLTPDKTIPKLREFVERGGTIIAIGSSAANLAAAFNLPIENNLVENGTPLPRTKFYVPGSLMTATVETASPFGQGVTSHVDMFFDDSPVFALGPQAAAAGVKRLAWFDNKAPLHSGWAWGQDVLENGVVAVEATMGKGRVLLFGPEILQRAQPHGTFKFLFNGIQLSGR